MSEKIPKISVIIPMYNVEDYVAECLDSLLRQTFQDFDVIVVDDCSTDNSREVVKNYSTKFEGRLRLIESEKNSGGCAVPRNIGMVYAEGKYLFFLDSDDLIVKTALERFYTVAEEFDADIVQCEKYFASDRANLKEATLRVKSFQPDGYVTVPTLETTSIAKRIMAFQTRTCVVTAWSKLLRREFMLEKKLKYPLTFNNEDLIFTLYCLSCAERLVRIPDPLNIYRYRPESIMHQKISLKEYVHRWMKAFALGFACCDEFLGGLDFYKEHPEIKYVALDAVAQDTFRRLVKVYQKYPAAALDEIIREEFAKFGNNPAMAAFFFNMSIMYSLQIGTYLLNKGK